MARAAATAFGGQPVVHRFYDRDEAHSVDVLSCEGRPVAGYTTYSTLGVHLTPNVMGGTDIRVELAGVCASGVHQFPNVLATAAFAVIKDGWLCAPGVVFESAVAQYGLSNTLQHLMWSPPSPWEELGAVAVASAFDVHWLLAVPISEAERRFLVDRGFDEFEALLADADADYFDLGRAPVV